MAFCRSARHKQRTEACLWHMQRQRRRQQYQLLLMRHQGCLLSLEGDPYYDELTGSKEEAQQEKQHNRKR